MKKLLFVGIIMILFPVLAFGADHGAGDWITLTPAAVPGAPTEGKMYWSAADDTLYIYDDGGAWYALGTEVFEFEPVATSPIAAQAGAVFYDSDDSRLKVYNGAAWEPLNEQTADEVYTEGSTITIDGTGSFILTSSLDDATDMLTITRTDAGSGTGQLIKMTDSQDAAHASVELDITFGNASSGGIHVYDNAADATNGAYLYKASSLDATKSVQSGFLAVATTANMMVTGFNGSDAEITNCLDCGGNTITGDSMVINTSWFDLEADGDISCTETGGSNGNADFLVEGFFDLGGTDGGEIGDGTNYVAFSNTGAITFAGTAKPTFEEWHPVQDLDLAIAGGDETDPTEKECGAVGKTSCWEFTEATDFAFYTWKIPEECDVASAINIYIVWISEDAGGDTCLWRVRHDGGKKMNNDEVPAAPATALDTPVADDTTDTQYEYAQTAAGIINASTFEDGDLVNFDFYLTDCDDGAVAEMVGFIIEYSLDSV